MVDHSVRFEDGDFTFRVSPISLDDYERVSDLLEAAHRRFRGGKAVRAFVEGFVPVAAPARDDVPLTVEDVGKLDPSLILALGRQWDEGVRNVPIPLPLRSSDTGI
jgi:hypothetical protein